MPEPDTMLAAFIRHTGGVQAIRVGQLPVPAPGPTDVLVRFAASEVNHVDLFVRSGAYATHTPFPFIIGRDLVGTVVRAGVGVAGFAAGQWVWCNSLGHAGRQGAWSQYVVVPADRLYPLPAGTPPERAAALLHGAATAHLGLQREARLRAGETLLLEGAGGAVGSAAVQMAKAMGARVIATASALDADWCAGCGADVVLDYRSDALWQQLRAAAPQGLDVWWDCSGHHHFEQVLPLLAPRARVVLASGLQGAQPVLPVGALYTRDASLHGFAISNASAADLAAAAADINRMLAAGQLRGRVGATYSLHEAGRAQQALAQGQVRGRIVVLP